MPGWSVEIADQFANLAAREGRFLNQMQLQELVYIAHGWCLAATGDPLTGDRPEALSHGPEYRRLAHALAALGTSAVSPEELRDIVREHQSSGRDDYHSELDQSSLDWIARTYEEFGDLDAARLAPLTRAADTPWAEVFADGAGEFKDIPHKLIRAQFARYLGRSE